MNENRAQLIALLLSDGSVYFDKSKRTYCIQFTNKVKGMRHVFKKLMEKSYKVNKFQKNKCRSAISVRVFSAKIARQLLLESNSFRTLSCSSYPKCNGKSCLRCIKQKHGILFYPSCSIPREILENKLFLRSFLRAYCSADGCVYRNSSHPNGVVEISCYHPNLKKGLKNAFRLCGVESRITRKGIIISKKASIRRFANGIGFLDESVVSASDSDNFGVKKNELLESCCSYS